MYVTYLLLALTILISAIAMDNQSLKYRLMLNPYDVIHHKKWYRCFTHAFVHGDWLHLGFNMYVLFSFGEVLEFQLILLYGLKGYYYMALLYLSAILFSSLLSLYINKNNPGYNSLGASGAVMAVLFAYILLFPTAELGLLFLPIRIPAFIFGPIILIAEYALSKRGGTGIAHDAHFAGAVYGIIFMTIVDFHFLLNFFNQFTR
jgi:membrane associated rhomboid family serine protease